MSDSPKKGIALLALMKDKMGSDQSKPDDSGDDAPVDSDALKKRALSKLMGAFDSHDVDAALKAYDQLCELHESGSDDSDEPDSSY